MAKAQEFAWRTARDHRSSRSVGVPSRRRLMTRRVCPAGLLVVLALALAAPGCSSGKRHKVTGKVLVNGRPAAGAIVVLTPAGDPGTMDRKPSAVAGEDGTF